MRAKVAWIQGLMAQAGMVCAYGGWSRVGLLEVGFCEVTGEKTRIKTVKDL